MHGHFTTMPGLGVSVTHSLAARTAELNKHPHSSLHTSQYLENLGWIVGGWVSPKVAWSSQVLRGTCVATGASGPWG